MLDWCQKQQPNQKLQEILFNPTDPSSNPIRPLHYKKALPSIPQQRRPYHGQHRKGLKLHFNIKDKANQLTQTEWDILTQKQAKDQSTQTQFVTGCEWNIERERPKTSNQLYSTYNNNQFIKVEPVVQKSTFLRGLDLTEKTWGKDVKRSWENDVVRQTKASCSLLSSNNHHQLLDYNFAHLQGVQSYHLPEPHPFPTQQRVIQSIQNIHQQWQEGKSYSECREGDVSFKIPSQSISEINLKVTPQKRILFHDRQTIVSKYNEDYESQRELKVEESLVYERDARSAFVTVLTYQSAHLVLALQPTINLLVSIKQIPLHRIAQIAQELHIYREIDLRQIELYGVLGIYQTQIDRHSYLLIKEPFTETFANHITNQPYLTPIYHQIEHILAKAQSQGLILRTIPQVDDFVICFDQIKIHNLSIWGWGRKGNAKIDIGDALRGLRQQVQLRLGQCYDIESMFYQ